METPYTVPEIARLTGIPETTLYDYVRQFSGIVPEVESPEENGRPRRRYPEQAIAVFQTIRHLKDRGVDLPTIRALLQEERTPESRADGPTPADVLESSLEAASALTEPTVADPEAETETLPEASPIVATVAEEAVPSVEESTERAAATEPTTDPEPGVMMTDEPILRGMGARLSVLRGSLDRSCPHRVRERGAGRPGDRHRDMETVPAPPNGAAPKLSITPGTNGAAPVVDGEIVALQGQLLGGLEESLRSLRALINTQNGDNQRLAGELKEQRDENERLRATIRYQKDQTRSAERLLAAIKTQCEEGIQTIAE